MSYFASTDIQFPSTLESWSQQHSEILVVFEEPNAAGAKEFEFFTSVEELVSAIVPDENGNLTPAAY